MAAKVNLIHSGGRWALDLGTCPARSARCSPSQKIRYWKHDSFSGRVNLKLPVCGLYSSQVRLQITNAPIDLPYLLTKIIVGQNPIEARSKSM